MRVALADDDFTVRSAIGLLLDQLPGVEIAGMAVDLADVTPLIACGAADVLLLDWELPGCDCDVVSRLISSAPGLLVIALSGKPQERDTALACGCCGFVFKGDPPDRLIELLDALSRLDEGKRL